MEIYIPAKIKGNGIEFNILAIWNFYWACKQGRFKGVREIIGMVSVEVL